MLQKSEMSDHPLLPLFPHDHHTTLKYGIFLHARAEYLGQI